MAISVTAKASARRRRRDWGRTTRRDGEPDEVEVQGEGPVGERDIEHRRTALAAGISRRRSIRAWSRRGISMMFDDEESPAASTVDEPKLAPAVGAQRLVPQRSGPDGLAAQRLARRVGAPAIGTPTVGAPAIGAAAVGAGGLDRVLVAKLAAPRSGNGAGVREALANVGRIERAAAATSMTPAPCSDVSVPGSGRAVARSSALTWSGVRVGRGPRIRAAVPEVKAAAWEVPLPRNAGAGEPAVDSSSSISSRERGGDQATAWGDEVGAAGGAAAVGEGGDGVVRGLGASWVRCADRDDVGVVGGLVECLGLVAVVAGGDDHDDAARQAFSTAWARGSMR